MNTQLSDITRHAYAPGFAPTWWDLFVEALAEYGLTPMMVGLLLLAAALLVLVLRRTRRRRRARKEISALDRALAKRAEAEARKEAAEDAARELRIRRATQGEGSVFGANAAPRA
jgi:hypothetical protein